MGEPELHPLELVVEVDPENARYVRLNVRIARLIYFKIFVWVQYRHSGLP